jgi:hypothetical protein
MACLTRRCQARQGDQTKKWHPRRRDGGRGRGTTEYENCLAPRGASGHCISICPHYQRLLILFTCRIRMADGNILNRLPSFL